MKPKMKVVILCGGTGTRLKEETEFRPKPLVEIGGKPLLWHIMKIYSHFGFNDFILCLGYKGRMIKKYFLDYPYVQNDFTLNLGSPGSVRFQGKHQEDRWNITCVDTGLETQTGGRIKAVQKYVDTNPFFCTYGDGVANIDLMDLLKFHENQRRIATISGVRPRTQFGIIKTGDDGRAVGFQEKPVLEDYVNGGFFVFNHQVFDFLKKDVPLEREPFMRLARKGELGLYPHKKFWQCLDTFKDQEYLNQLWTKGKPPWRIWGRDK